jgi:hypothetical protein
VRRAWLTEALRVLAAAAVFVTPALWELLHRTSFTGLTNGDFWWHLSTGLGILQNHALPHSGWFSQSAALPWMASSWLYDVVVAVGFRGLDLRFLLLLSVAAKFALAVAVFVLAGGTRGRFWTAILLSAIAQYVLGQMPPLPALCSVVALAIELALLFDFRRSGQIRQLYYLPLLFLLWANLDPLFVYGILALLLFTAVCVAERSGVAWLASAQSDAPITTIAAITGISLIATFVTPYGWSGWSVFWARATSAANAYFPDFQSLRFRTPQDYVLMLLAMAAFLALGIRRSRDWFAIGLLVLATMAAFHAQRDTWLLVLAAVAVIANADTEEALSRERQATSFRPRATFLVATGVGALALLAFVAALMPGRDALLAKIGEHYPVAAADYIRANHLPTPLFNPYPWGGFLTWYLQYPVAIDGRTELYGPDFNVQYAKVMNFDAHYSTFAPLSGAGTILLDKSSPMGKALPSAHGFKTVYSDNVAVVLIREPDQP